jgi:hypothetical protein
MSVSVALPWRRSGWSWRAYVELASVWALAYVVVAMVLAGVVGGHVEALRAAGLAGGSEIGGVAGFFDALKSNLVWLGVTVVGFAIVLIAILFLSGHSRAHDIALKVGVGVFLLVAAPGIVA